MVYEWYGLIEEEIRIVEGIKFDYQLYIEDVNL